MGIGTLSADPRDHRSVRLKEDLLTEWKALRTAPPADRARWLNTQEAMTTFSARERADIVKKLKRLRRRIVRYVPSGTWLDDAYRRGVAFPPGGDDTRMVMSRVETRVGEDGQMSRRYTPPQAVEEEDAIDCMSVKEATWGTPRSWPASPSAIAIQRIEARKGVQASDKELARYSKRSKRAGKPDQTAAVDDDSLPPELV